MSVKLNEKNMLNWNQRMNMYEKSIEFSKKEILRQRQLEIEDFNNEIATMKKEKKYDNDYIKSLEYRFKKWLENDIELEKTLYI